MNITAAVTIPVNIWIDALGTVEITGPINGSGTCLPTGTGRVAAQVWFTGSHGKFSCTADTVEDFAALLTAHLRSIGEAMMLEAVKQAPAAI